MNAYVFGRHTGDLPTHLVGRGEPGSRIRAVTKLDGPDHTVFVALEVADLADMDTHMSVLMDAQVTPTVSFGSCEDPLCLDKIGEILSRISVINPREILVFILLEIEEALEILREIVHELGPDRVAAATDGHGLVGVELTGDDRAELEKVVGRLQSVPGARVRAAHWARKSEHHVAS